jgi:hypothetical protein
MATTIVDLIDEVRLILNDALPDSGVSRFLTDAQIEELILMNSLAEATYTFQKLSDEYYRYMGKAWFFNPSFTEAAVSPDLTYVFNSTGSIKVDGTDGRASISVTAIKVNLYRVIADALIYLATNHAQDVALSNNSGSWNPQTVRQELMSQASHWSQEEWLYE